jgi:DNA-binding response OmpR family regulator
LESHDPRSDAGGIPTVLVCDDEDSLRELIRAVLGDGFEFVEAKDGDEALEILSSRVPSVVVLDLMLPRTSGVDVLAAVRSDPRLAGMPVVVVSAWSHLEREALDAGADRFVAKPFDPDDLAAVVDELVRR